MIDEFFDDPDYIKPEPVKEEVKEEPIEKKESRSMFEVMSTVINKKFWPTAEEVDKINSFMLTRYISNDGVGIQAAAALDHYGSKMPMAAQYRYVRFTLSDKISYIKFPKKEKVANQDEINIIQQHYKINERTAIEYIKLMTETQLQEIVDLYTKMGKIGKKVKK